MPRRPRKVTYKRHVVNRLAPCRECGSPTPARSNYVVCDECKILMHRWRERHILREVHYKVVYDPLGYPDGYNPGAMFSVTEMNCMQQANNQSLTPGMILSKGDQYYKVEQPNCHGKQNLVLVEAPDFIHLNKTN